MKKKYSKEELISIVKSSSSFKDSCKKISKKYNVTEAAAKNALRTYKIKRKNYCEKMFKPNNWTEEEENILLKHINNNNYNILLGAELCSKELDRTKAAIIKQWYKNTRYKKAAFVNIGNRGVSNVKNQKRGTELPDTPDTFSFMINGMTVESASVSSLSINF